MRLAVLLALSLLSACASENKKVAESEADVVIARIDKMESRPAWVKESEVFRIENGSVLLTGKATISADQNVEQAFRIAENNARAVVAKAIETKMQFIFQNAEEGLTVDANQARFIGMDATEIMKTSSIRPHKRYWEKYRTTLDSGEKVTKIDTFAILQMPEVEFKKAVLDAVRARQGKGGISKDFAKKVDQQWDTFLKPVSSEASE